MNNPQSSPPPVPQTSNGLSVTSLVLGILSLVPCSIFAGIPAIITGHIAKSRATKQPELYGGAGMALAGLIMGYVSVALLVILIPFAVLPALLLPALSKAKQRAQTVSCVSNMKQVALAARMWSNNHNDTYPPDFLSMSNELNPAFLVCPQDSSKTKVMNWADFNPALNASYEFLTPGAKEADIVARPAFRCPIHGNVALGDGSVQQSNRRR
jgi:competence protein ComGC